ncbi:MAG: hypothetical protein AB1724_08065 [Thermodesulfobacteriota bacterium]
MATSADDGPWDLLLEKHDIRVYARPVPDSTLREYRAEILLDAGISCVSAVLDDIPAAVEWFPFCLSAGVIDDLPDGRKIIMNIADFPWPFQDRYAVFSSRKMADNSRKQIVVAFGIDDVSGARSIDDRADTRDMIRLPFMRGQWTLAAIDGEKTQVVYTICADAGGSIPLWLIKTFFEDTPYKTLENLRKMVKKPKYLDSVMPEQDRQEPGRF